MDIIKKQKHLNGQSAADKMNLLRIISARYLNPSWQYYRSIKHTSVGNNLLAQPNLATHMKATRAALTYTSKVTKKAYWASCKSSIGDVKSRGGLKKEALPEMPAVEEGKGVPSLTAELDAFIIQWTPLKFLSNSKIIREKGQATQRHSEGLVAKLTFKVVGYYADPVNWDIDKLCVYLRKINEETSYAEIVSILEPLKKDLEAFTDSYQAFKFGNASLMKGAASEEEAHDDSFGTESTKDQLKLLYFYHFIYEGIEQFLFKYFALLIFSTPNKQAIRYLSELFEPAIQKAILTKKSFIGGFEFDRNRRALSPLYKTYCASRLTDPQKAKISTKKIIYEAWNYNLPLIQRYSLHFQGDKIPIKESTWGVFIEAFLHDRIAPGFLGCPPPTEAEEEEGAYERPKLPAELRKLAFTYLLNQLLINVTSEKDSRTLLLERLRKSVTDDKLLIKNMLGELKSQAEKNLRATDRKIKALKRMKQDKSAEVFEEDIKKIRLQVESRATRIHEHHVALSANQNKKINKLLLITLNEKELNTRTPAGRLISLANSLDPDGDFTQDFIRFTADEIRGGYVKHLEPYYKGLFIIMSPSVFEKIRIIRALEYAGMKNGVQLKLSEKETQENLVLVNKLTARVKQLKPDVFSAKLYIKDYCAPLVDLIAMGLTSQTWCALLTMKFTSLNNPRPARLESAVCKGILALNLVSIPTQSCVLEPETGTEETKGTHSFDPTQLIKLHQLFLKQRNVPSFG